MKIKIRILNKTDDYHAVYFYECGNISLECNRLYITRKGMFVRLFEYLTSAKSIRTLQRIKKMENEIRKMKESL